MQTKLLESAGPGAECGLPVRSQIADATNNHTVDQIAQTSIATEKCLIKIDVTDWTFFACDQRRRDAGQTETVSVFALMGVVQHFAAYVAHHNVLNRLDKPVEWITITSLSAVHV
jgi:hypothetical protein